MRFRYFTYMPQNMKFEKFNLYTLGNFFFFSAGDIALITDLGLINMFSANQNVEIVACLLLQMKTCWNLNI